MLFMLVSVDWDWDDDDDDDDDGCIRRKWKKLCMITEEPTFIRSG